MLLRFLLHYCGRFPFRERLHVLHKWFHQPGSTWPCVKKKHNSSHILVLFPSIWECSFCFSFKFFLSEIFPLNSADLKMSYTFFFFSVSKQQDLILIIKVSGCESLCLCSTQTWGSLFEDKTHNLITGSDTHHGKGKHNNTRQHKPTKTSSSQP